jgi:hypothetical protein
MDLAPDVSHPVRLEGRELANMPRANRPVEVVVSKPSVADSSRPPTPSTRSTAMAQSSRFRETLDQRHTTSTSARSCSIISMACSTWRRFQNRPLRSRSSIVATIEYPRRAQ